MLWFRLVLFVLSSGSGSISLNSVAAVLDVAAGALSFVAPRSLPVSSFAVFARCFGDAWPGAHAQPGKDPCDFGRGRQACPCGRNHDEARAFDWRVQVASRLIGSVFVIRSEWWFVPRLNVPIRRWFNVVQRNISLRTAVIGSWWSKCT